MEESNSGNSVVKYLSRNKRLQRYYLREMQEQQESDGNGGIDGNKRYKNNNDIQSEPPKSFKILLSAVSDQQTVPKALINMSK